MTNPTETASGHPAENDAPRCEDGGHTFPPPVTSGMSCACGLLVVDARVTSPGVDQ